MQLTIEMIRKIAKGKPNVANATSVLVALNQYGKPLGLHLPHRAAQFLAQIFHESAEFRYDREIWGPTAAQQRYDTRTDLGNTPEKDGDGKLYMGRTAIQITGKSNYRQFTEWCRANVSSGAPNFVANPDLVNTDPWEGLGPIWYWSTRNLNRYADEGDIEMITKRINGGLNGYADRLQYYTRVALVMLGYEPTAIRAFQTEAKRQGIYTGTVDGLDGPRTRSALHQALVALSSKSALAPETKPAPVVVSEAVVPAEVEKEVEKEEKRTWIQWAGVIPLAGVGGFFRDYPELAWVATGGVVVIAVIALFGGRRLVRRVKEIAEEVRS